MTLDRDELRRQFDLRRDAGRVLAAALARFIEAYESSPDRALHALSWEHLPGRVHSHLPISEQAEASAKRSSESAKDAIQTSMLHQSETPLADYTQLLDDWDLVSRKADAESFKIDEYLASNHLSWEITGAGLTPSEERRLRGWSLDDVERLRSRDPELLNEYRRELEEAASEQVPGLRSLEDRQVWIEARLADTDSAARSKMLVARVYDLDAQFLRWKLIEQLRVIAEKHGALLLWMKDWAETPEKNRPLIPVYDDKEFPDSLTHEMRSLYETANRFWLARNRDNIDDVGEYESLVAQLIALSKAQPTTAGLAVEMARREKDRAENQRFGPRVPIPANYGWYEYCSLALDDEANFENELEDEVRKNGRLWIHWSKELVGMLPAVAQRAVEFGRHPISDIPRDRLPESLAVLFEQAHLCYLFNLAIPCAMVCGSLIEEAIETRFPELRDKWEEWSKANNGKQVGWKFKKRDLLETIPSFEGVKGKADDVVYGRNDAVHNPGKFLLENRGRRSSILGNTREVLQRLFDEDPQVK